MPPKPKDVCPISVTKVKDANVLALVDHLKRIAGERIFLCRWNFDYAFTNAPVGLGVKQKDIDSVKKVLASIIGNGTIAKEHLQYDLSVFSKIPGTHLNIFKSGRLELQGAPVGDGKNKRFPVSTTFVLGGFLDLVSQLYEGLTAERPQASQATSPKRVTSISSLTSAANSVDSQLNLDEELEHLSDTPPLAEESSLTLPEEKLLLDMFRQVDKKKRHEMAAKILELDDLPTSESSLLENQARINSKPISFLGGHKSMAEVVAETRVQPTERVVEAEVQYKILPIFLANSFPTNIISDPKQLSITVKSLQPNAEFEVQVLKYGDIKIMAKSPHDYAILKQPWPEHPDFGIVSPKLPSLHTVNQSVLILGLSKLVSEGEIEAALKESNIFPKDKGIHRFNNTASQAPPVKVTLDSKEEKDKIIQGKFHIYHQRFNVVSFEEDPPISQCHKCQQFGHHARSCSSEQRCNRCGGGHKHTECQVNRDEAKCCNCGGAHAASFKGCVRYKSAVAAEKDKSKETRRSNLAVPPQAHVSSNATAKPSVSALLTAMAEIMASFLSSLKVLSPQSNLNPQMPFNIVSSVAKAHLNIHISPVELQQMASMTTPLAISNQNLPFIPSASQPSPQTTLPS
jgi:hypothetical protein